MSTRNFVLPKTWCALNFMKYVGFYPFYRHPEMGLQPVATFRYWILYLGYYFTSSVCINGVCAYILIFEATFEDIKEAYRTAFMESSTDSVALFVCTILYSIIHLSIAIQLRRVVKDILEFQEIYSKRATLASDEENVSRGLVQNYVFKYIVFHMIIGQFGLFLSNAGWIFQTTSLVSDISMVASISLLVSYTPFLLIFQMPMVYFKLMYGEICCNMISWSQNIQEFIDEDDFTNQVKVFNEALEIASNAFSSIMFWSISIFQIGIIMLTYYVLSTYSILISGNFKWDQLLFALGMGILCIISIMDLIYFCTMSEKVLKAVKTLKCMSLERCLKMFILLDQFNGFDANGFFNLKHSLLSSMTANFVCYMVVLMQFKQSEKL